MVANSFQLNFRLIKLFHHLNIPIIKCSLWQLSKTINSNFNFAKFHSIEHIEQIKIQEKLNLHLEVPFQLRFWNHLVIYFQEIVLHYY